MLTYTSLLSYLMGWKRTLTKTILGFHLVFILPSSKYNVNGHENLTTTTFYGHRVKQKTISIRLNFLMPSSWYDVTVHNGLTTTFNHHHIYITQKIRISTYFPTAFFTVLRHSHKCLTTHTRHYVIRNTIPAVRVPRMARDKPAGFNWLLQTVESYHQRHPYTK